MSKIICIAQSKKELKFILNKIKYSDRYIFLPVNLETQLYCIIKNLNYIKLQDIFDKDFQKKAIEANKSLSNNLNLSDLKYESEKQNFSSSIRFKLNSIIFLLESVRGVQKKIGIDKILISGWNENVAEYSTENYFLSKMVLDIFNDIKIESLTNIKPLENKKNNSSEYYIEQNISSFKGTYVLLNNIGYNFLRIITLLFFRNIKSIVPIDITDYNNLNFFKKIVFKILGINFLIFYQKKFDNTKNTYSDAINFEYDKKDISSLFKDFIRIQKNYIFKSKSKNQILDKIFEKVKIKFVVSNLSRDFSGYIIEKAIEKNIPGILIPHGTLSESFDEHDKIYKDIIKESLIINKKNVIVAAQSKITSKNLSNNLNNKINEIQTGNLIFANKRNSFLPKKNKILYAVTLKEFFNIQYYGCEMFYEYLENLNFLNNLAKNIDNEIIVKPHPTEFKCLDYLKNNYKNLKFSTKKINQLLCGSFVSVSFSSTVIEDSLHAKVPVILFDKWRRYKHCSASTDPKKKNCAIYYINNEQDFKSCLQTVKSSSNPDFNNYIFNTKTDIKKNLNNLIEKVL